VPEPKQHNSLQEQALACLGRNVLHYQRVEAQLKRLVVLCDLTATFDSLAALQAEGTTKTMGALVNELHTRLYGIAVEPEVQKSIAEAYIQVRLRVNADPSFVAQQKKLLSDLVLERNALIHQDLAEFDPRSQESCRRWITRLNEQNERILAQHKELQQLLDMTSEGAKHLLADLEAESTQRAQTRLS
jgi:hypothetical protein